MIEIRNEQDMFHDFLFLDRLTHLVRKILIDHDAGGYGVSFLLCDNTAIHDLNALYRGKDGPTDVLSFSLQEGEPLEDFSQAVVEDDGGELVELLGDVVISVQQARAQAEENELSWAGELAHLAIHGVLHLLGYDHEGADKDAEAMFDKQEVYLAWFLSQYPEYAMAGEQKPPEIPSKA